VLPAATLLFARQYAFDVLFVFTTGYAAFAWLPIYPHEKKAFFERYRQWSTEVSAK
jgi:hypothetical protein